MTRIVFAADDFGFNAAVDAGIAELAERDVLNAASCMVLGPRWTEAARTAGRLRGRIDLGLHLDLTEFGPAGSLPSLVIRTQLRSLSVRRLREQIHAQLQRFQDSLGVAPDYLDGHQHVHQFPQVADALLEELGSQPPDCVRWVRISRPPALASLKARLISALALRDFVPRVQATGRRTSGALLGVYGFDLDSSRFAALLGQVLAAARDGDVVMLHPASASLSGDPIGAARLVEFEVLRAGGIDDLCARHDIRRVRGTDLFGPAADGS
jgi:predicted glycoside hydrolase/deacetylase ChbG (UPF0249 family)